MLTLVDSEGKEVWNLDRAYEADEIIKHTFLLPPMKLKVKLYNSNLAYSYLQDLELNGGSLNEDLIQAPEGRATIQVNLVDGFSKFKQIDYNYIIAMYTNRESSPNNSLAPHSAFKKIEGCGNRDGFDKGIIDYCRFSNQKLLESVKVYPLAMNTSYRYLLAVNEHEAPLPRLTENSIFEIPVATFNVYSLKTGNRPEYILYSNKDNPNLFNQVRLKNSHYNDRVWERSLTAPSSLFLPFGYKYRFDFYSTDDQGKVSLNDQVEADLTN